MPWDMLRERPPKRGGYTTHAPALDLTTSLRGGFVFFATNGHFGRGGGGGHVAWVHCSRLQLAAPIGRSSLPLEPFPPSAVVLISLSLPCVLPLPPCAIFPSPHMCGLSFPLVGCANGPGLSLFQCSVGVLLWGFQWGGPPTPAQMVYGHSNASLGMRHGCHRLRPWA